jgi:hypothetical protein
MVVTILIIEDIMVVMDGVEGVMDGDEDAGNERVH